METQTTIQQCKDAQFSDFCQLDIPLQEEFEDPVYLEFLNILRRVFIELDMASIFRTIPRE